MYEFPREHSAEDRGRGLSDAELAAFHGGVHGGCFPTIIIDSTGKMRVSGGSSSERVN